MVKKKITYKKFMAKRLPKTPKTARDKVMYYKGVQFGLKRGLAIGSKWIITKKRKKK